MVAEITAAIQSVRVLNDLVQANRSFRNFNELVSAVAEVNAKLAAAWSVALTSQEKQTTLSQRIGELEKEIAELKNWDRERERYQLTEIASGRFAYRVKKGMENDEPSHDLGANCFTQNQKAIFQLESWPTKKLYCQRCKTAVVLEY